MDLKTYRTTVAGISRAKAGEALGVDGVTVYRWETGRSYPAPDLQQKVIEWSGSQVTADDMLETFIAGVDGVILGDSEGVEPA